MYVVLEPETRRRLANPIRISLKKDVLARGEAKEQCSMPREDKALHAATRAKQKIPAPNKGPGQNVLAEREGGYNSSENHQNSNE